MDDVLIVFIAILAGFFMAGLAALAGAHLACKLLAGKEGLSSFAPEPQGEVFTIEDPEGEALFPEENVEEEETGEHILKRTEKFLQTLGGNKQ
jgi:hypothetical protein